MAKYINSKTRFIDILAAATVARIPYYLLPFFNYDNHMATAAEETLAAINPGQLPDFSVTTISLLLVFAFFTILFLIWYMVLLFRGFKVASNAKGALPVVLFVIAIILAEISSKFLIVKLTAI